MQLITDPCTLKPINEISNTLIKLGHSAVGPPCLLQRVGVFVSQIGTDVSFNELRILSDVPVSLFLRVYNAVGHFCFSNENAFLPN